MINKFDSRNKLIFGIGKELYKFQFVELRKSSSGETAYNGKGISVGYLDKDDYYQYQVLRFYK